MAIFRGSRYTNTLVDYDEEGNLSFEDRPIFKFNRGSCSQYIFCKGDRLDILANKFYGDSRYWWVILEANPTYCLEEQIQVGDIVLIPSASEVGALYDQ